MNKFQNDKRKALNREHARLRYIYQKTLNLYSVIPRVKSPRRMLKIANQIFTLTIQARHQFVIIEAIRQQPIPRFPSGGVVSTVQFETINIHKDARKPERVAIMDFGGRNTGRYWAQKMAGELRVGIDTAIGKDKTAYTEYKDGKVSKIDFTEAIEALRNHINPKLTNGKD